jgi:hypothetical protein
VNAPLRQLLRIALAATACVLALAVGAVAAQAATECSRVASPSGSDRAAGTEAAPYASLERLVESLDPGETGCLRGGTYGGDSVYFDTPNAALRSYPGETATITAFMEVRPDAVGAHIHHLRFDASFHDNNTGVKLQADYTHFSDNELTKGGNGICLIAGSYNPAKGIVIERNRIYDCGPPSSKLMHQIYLGNTRGAIVRWNILSGNAGGWGVHLYTNADDTLIEHNIIDGNQGGVIFAGEGGQTSDRNVVRNNAITYSSPRWNVEGSWSGGQPGVGNSAHDNCIYTAGRDAPAGIGDEHGFDAYGNQPVGGSPYADRQHGDYRFTSSACAQLVGDVAGAVSGVASPPPAAKPARIAQRIQLTLASSKKRAAPAQRLRLSGRLSGDVATRSPFVVLQVRQNGRWRGFERARLHSSGRFATRIRTGRSRRARVSPMRAVVPGVARSRAIRLRIHP